MSYLLLMIETRQVGLKHVDLHRLQLNCSELQRLQSVICTVGKAQNAKPTVEEGTSRKRLVASSRRECVRGCWRAAVVSFSDEWLINDRTRGTHRVIFSARVHFRTRRRWLRVIRRRCLHFAANAVKGFADLSTTFN